ncbi:folate family ECF transporter S component [Bacillus rubiinfantis]|uniref:folate family ECF transporter S component n=1 Tax=Bacillus rubiinfantis TaxID=1499680 RepID=UPI0005A96D7D|nr:folate family ECF transporter S component [Bacillus rubiinfantis]
MRIERQLPTTTTYSRITTKQITVTGLLVALNLVLNQMTLSLGPTLEIGFAFLPIALLAYLYGPINAGIASAAADVIGFFLRPNGFFFPGFTLNAIVMGVIYGLVLHKKKVTLTRIIIAVLLEMIIVNLILTPIWLKIMYGSSLFALPRIIKTIVLLPINVGLLYMLIANYNKFETRREHG